MSLNLETISGIGKATAESLRAAGIDSVQKLAKAKLEELLEIKGIGKSTAEKYIEIAKDLLDEAEVIEVGPEEVKSPISKETYPVEKKEKKPKTQKKEQKEDISVKKFEKLLKKQAECNIGLVGHVDHGKTTLVKSLTGDWTDRHSEEQERGISIKLGYSNATILYCPECDVYTTLHLIEKARKKGQPRYRCPDCQGQVEFKRNISFVDAPGHEILMATMLSGASLMDGACLLIAADEPCPQPQTREHLAALDIAGIENIIIIQNKIDAVSREDAIQNQKEIKKFVEGTVADEAPIIPISAVFGANIELIIKAFQDIIPTPAFDSEEDFQFLIARSFDVNKPGTEIDRLIGGVIGGSVLRGKITVGEEIEIRPGLKGKNEYEPIKSKVISISQGNNFLEEAKPGGLIGLGTKLDPALTKSDALIGQLVGKIGKLPTVRKDIELEVHLLDRVIGAEEMIKVHELKHGERLLMVVGTEKVAGVVSKILKDTYKIDLNPPVCVPDISIFAISRIINRRYRLIGYGIPVD
ncbi:MAG: translation initiation factor IF-2 subunit gamma [Candidatus Lokiarchaeota archaeon]|nr:translation initiation factor IF-2 subunit gamma [Candidatus Lokiarchaeota archaeon]MBD3199398.1 translation initiation factor IF-2 subunit gamma [Candidatus Lokiarchaeota archaeon]